ncbi:MAG: hypothetical protein FWH32_02490 [Clostridiales bacterium]|nr:hypothetical protein [Clostridiales bacterium]
MKTIEMNRKRYRLIVWVLTLVLIIAMVPLSTDVVFAEGEASADFDTGIAAPPSYDEDDVGEGETSEDEETGGGNDEGSNDDGGNDLEVDDTSVNDSGTDDGDGADAGDGLADADEEEDGEGENVDDGLLAMADDELISLDDDDGRPDTSWFNWGTRNTTTNYVIENGDQLAGLAQIVNSTVSNVRFDFAGKTIALADDIDISMYGYDYNDEKGWIPIGSASQRPFKGTFDGAGRNISGLYISNGLAISGLFGHITSGTVRNLSVEVDRIEVHAGSNIRTGGIVGVLSGRMENCNVSGSIGSIGRGIGGLVGRSERNSVIVGSHSEAKISGGSYVGGVVGELVAGTVTDSSSTGSVTGYSHVGGVVGGMSGGKVEGSHSTSDIDAESRVGGVVGDAAGNALITGSHYRDGNVDGINMVGGVVGAINTGSVTNSYSDGGVTGTTGVGGIVGDSNKAGVSNAYSIGDVSGSVNVGGIAGSIASHSVAGCYSTGIVSGIRNVGGIVGFGSGNSAGATNSAALNLRVRGDTNVGRVAGTANARALSGNVAFEGMTVLVGSSDKTVSSGLSSTDGMSRSKDELQAATGFPEVFMQMPWTYAPEMLPGLFGSEASMPGHLYDGPAKVLTTSAQSGLVGVEYSYALVGAGAAPIAWSLESGTLPDGFALGGDGVISGVPTAYGVTTFTVKAENSKGFDTKELSLTIKRPVTILAIEGIPVPRQGDIPVTTITETSQYTGRVTWMPRPRYFDYGTEYIAVIDVMPKPEYTLVGIARDAFTVAGAVATNGANSGVIRAVFPPTETKLVTTLSVQPSFATLTPAHNTLPLAGLLPGVDLGDYGKLKWSLEDDIGGILSLSQDAGMSTELTADSIGLGAMTEPKDVSVVAEFDGRYTAFVSISLMPETRDEWLGAQMLVQSVNLNTAKEIGALAPIRIRGDKVDNVELLPVDKDGEVAGIEPLKGYQAHMHADGRNIAISADFGVPKANRSMVRIHFSGGVQLDAGVVALAAKETYPRITLSLSERLNAFLPENTAAIVGRSSDGSEVKVERVAYRDLPAGRGFAEIGGADGNTIKATGKGGERLVVKVGLEGYKRAYKPNNGNNIGTTANFTASVVDAAPSIKLGRSSIPLLGAENGGGSALVSLLSRTRSVDFESGYTVADVVRVGPYEGITAVYEGDGLVRVAPVPSAGSGTAALRVSFHGTDRTQDLRLKVSMVRPNKLSAAIRPARVIVNVNQQGHIADLAIVPNVANMILNNWRVKESNAEGIDVGFDNNVMQLSVAEGFDLGAAYSFNSRRRIEIETPSMPGKVSMFSVNIVTRQVPTANIRLRNRIDIALPDSAIMATVTLRNITSGIKGVRLYEQNKVGSTVMEPVKESELFEVFDLRGNTFMIRTMEGAYVAPTSYRLSYVIELENGQELASWRTTFSNSGGRVNDRPLMIRVMQTRGRVWRSAGPFILDSATPMLGETIGLRFSGPAGVKLGAVSISYRTRGSFELVRSGENEWTVFSRSPKGHHSLWLDLWAEGTYSLDENGHPQPLGVYDARDRFRALSRSSASGATIHIL